MGIAFINNAKMALVSKEANYLWIENDLVFLLKIYPHIGNRKQVDI